MNDCMIVIIIICIIMLLIYGIKKILNFYGVTSNIKKNASIIAFYIVLLIIFISIILV